MVSLIDSMIDTHHAPGGDGGLIVSENHDASKINWVAGIVDPGEMIGCGQYQELRRQEGENDKAYQERLVVLLAKLPVAHREQIEVAMREAANKRAGLDTSNGRINFAGVGGSWHDLGVNVSRAMNWNEASTLGGVRWRAEIAKLYWKDPISGDELECDDTFAVVRQDTGTKLGTVGARYKIIQNEDAGEFLDHVLGEFGARYETIGSIFGGKKVFMTVHLPKQRFKVNGTDSVEPYAVFTNPHDGSGQAFCFPVTEAPRCANTLRVALAGKKGKGIGIRHTGNIKARIHDAKVAMGLTIEGMERFKDEAQEMGKTKMKPEKFFNLTLDAVMDVTEAEAKKGADILAAMLKVDEAEREAKKDIFQKAIDKRQDVLEMMLEANASATNGGANRGTLWGNLNAVTQVVDHDKVFRFKGDTEVKNSRRFESFLYGDGDDIKQGAYETAVANLKA